MLQILYIDGTRADRGVSGTTGKLGCFWADEFPFTYSRAGAAPLTAVQIKLLAATTSTPCPLNHSAKLCGSRNSGGFALRWIHPSLTVSPPHARAEPGRLTYASGGVGSSNHLSGALFALAANLDLTHVSYRGAAPAMTALYAGEIDMVFASTVETLPHVQGGRARLLGVAGPRRLPALPDTPAINETVPGYVALNWYAIAAPRATPPAIIARMAEVLGSIRDLPDVRTRFAAAGTTPLLTGPAELAALLETDVPQWQRVVAATGIKVE